MIKDDYTGWGWFGRALGAPVESMWPKVEPPIGRACGYCAQPIEKDDDGVLLPFHGAPPPESDLPYHRDCFIKALGIDKMVIDKV